MISTITSEPLKYVELERLAHVPAPDQPGLAAVNPKVAEAYRAWLAAVSAAGDAELAWSRVVESGPAKRREESARVHDRREDTKVELRAAEKALLVERRAALAQITPVVQTKYFEHVSALQEALDTVDGILSRMESIECVSRAFAVDGGANMAPARHALSGVTVSELIHASVRHWRAVLERVIAA